MTEETNPFLQPENFFDGYKKHEDPSRQNQNVDFEKLCYQLFENELGKKYWEFVTERFLLQGFVDPASPAAPHMGVYYEGFKEGFRMSLRAIKSHKNRIAAESIKE